MQMQGRIRGVLFDKDGTLFDFQATWGGWAAGFFRELSGGDAALEARIASAMGFDSNTHRFHNDSVVVARTAHEVAEALTRTVPGWSVDKMLARMNETASAAPQIQPVPLVPLLAGLRARGLKLGLATNDAEAPARAHLNTAKITHLFDFIAGFDSGFGGKPDTGMQCGFCAQTGLTPDQVVMVGDSVHDLQSGHRAGMTTIAVLSGVAKRAELAPHADVVLANIGGIPAWLGLQTGHRPT